MILLADRNFGGRPSWPEDSPRPGRRSLVRVRTVAGPSRPSWTRPPGRLLAVPAPAGITSGSSTSEITITTTPAHRRPLPVGHHPPRPDRSPAVPTWPGSTTSAGRSRPPSLQPEVRHPGRTVLRARTPDGVAQEIYALLITYQALRTAIDGRRLTQPGTDPTAPASPSRRSAARDPGQPGSEITDGPAPTWPATSACRVLAAPLPSRRPATSPRVVKTRHIQIQRPRHHRPHHPQGHHRYHHRRPLDRRQRCLTIRPCR